MKPRPRMSDSVLWYLLSGAFGSGASVSGTAVVSGAFVSGGDVSGGSVMISSGSSSGDAKVSIAVTISVSSSTTVSRYSAPPMMSSLRGTELSIASSIADCGKNIVASH